MTKPTCTPKDIIREYDRLRYLAFGDKIRQRSRQWQKANKPRINLYARRWRKKNRKHYRKWRMVRRAQRREKMNAVWRKWYVKNKPKRHAANRRWRQNNYAHIVVKNSRRRALQKRAKIGCQKAVARIYRRAKELRQWFDVVVDHIKPLAKGGIHAAENLQIIYRSENSQKRSNLFYIPSVVFQ